MWTYKHWKYLDDEHNDVAGIVTQYRLTNLKSTKIHLWKKSLHETFVETFLKNRQEDCCKKKLHKLLKNNSIPLKFCKNITYYILITNIEKHFKKIFDVSSFAQNFGIGLKLDTLSYEARLFIIFLNLKQYQHINNFNKILFQIICCFPKINFFIDIFKRYCFHKLLIQNLKSYKSNSFSKLFPSQSSLFSLSSSLELVS